MLGRLLLQSLLVSVSMSKRGSKVSASSASSSVSGTTAAANKIQLPLLGPQILSLAPLRRAVIASRPSRTIKSPYVADVMMESEVDTGMLIERIASIRASSLGGSSTSSPAKASKQLHDSVREHMSMLEAAVHLAHAPSLDCSGMVVPGSAVWMTAATGATAKTSWTIQLCEELRTEGPIRVGYHPMLAENIAKQLLLKNLLSESLGDLSGHTLKGQQTFGASRVDFVLTKEAVTRGEERVVPEPNPKTKRAGSKRKAGADQQDQQVAEDDAGEMLLVEVKNVVGADYAEGTVPPSRSPVGVYLLPAAGKGHKRHAIFPVGNSSNKPGLKGIVSDRAIKHVNELTALHGTLHASGKRLRCAILFVVNRGDCDAFRPCHEADLLFAQCLLRAKEAGVALVAQEVVWGSGSSASSASDEAMDNTCTAGRCLPVVFDPSVRSADIDETLLAACLAFNAQGGGKTKEAKGGKEETEGKGGKGGKRKKRKVVEDDDDEEDDAEED